MKIRRIVRKAIAPSERLREASPEFRALHARWLTQLRADVLLAKIGDAAIINLDIRRKNAA